ncbi:gametocyte-specific factor 1-like [Antennarius striatus]|uniref:gametocyte-specific factor 1-like n=1 Tax=Antennarius striatus TaxID=241820 RepID=UPI0035B496D2
MAHTLQYGTTCGPHRATAAAVRANLEEEDENGDYDPDKLRQCPFDKSHQIRASRFPYHLIKCRNNHPKLARELKTCPFSACHLVPEHELRHHIETCKHRKPDQQDCEGSTGFCKSRAPVRTWVNPNLTEDWEEAADGPVGPFVFGVNTGLKELPESRPKNLDTMARRPATIPWHGKYNNV